MTETQYTNNDSGQQPIHKYTLTMDNTEVNICLPYFNLGIF